MRLSDPLPGSLHFRSRGVAKDLNRRHAAVDSLIVVTEAFRQFAQQHLESLRVDWWAHLPVSYEHALWRSPYASRNAATCSDRVAK